MRWDYLFRHASTTFMLSPFLAWFLQHFYDVAETSIEALNVESGEAIIVIFFTVLFWLLIYFFLCFYYSIIPVIIYILVFCILGRFNINPYIVKGLLITTMLLCIMITFYVVLDTIVTEDFLLQTYCGVAIASGLFYKIRNLSSINQNIAN